MNQIVDTILYLYWQACGTDKNTTNHLPTSSVGNILVSSWASVLLAAMNLPASPSFHLSLKIQDKGLKPAHIRSHKWQKLQLTSMERNHPKAKIFASISSNTNNSPTQQKKDITTVSLGAWLNDSGSWDSHCGVNSSSVDIQAHAGVQCTRPSLLTWFQSLSSNLRTNQHLFLAPQCEPKSPSQLTWSLEMHFHRCYFCCMDILPKDLILSSRWWESGVTPA